MMSAQRHAPRSAPLRLAYVCTDPGIPVFGTKGASIHAQEMIAAFLALGAEVTLFSPRIGRPLPGFEPVRLHPLRAAPAGEAEDRARHHLALNDDLAAALAAGPFDLIYERHALFAHAAMETAARLGIPGVQEVNAPLLDESRRHRSLPLPEAATESLGRAFRAATLVCAVSPKVAEHARAHGAGRVEVVPNGVNPARFPPLTRPDDRLVIGFLGTLKPWHDVEILTRALPILRETHPGAQLLLVGDGPERERLGPVLADLGAELAGAVAPGEVAEWLGRMDVAVAPYRGDQPFYFSPLKIYEYMAAGLPVVASDVGDLAGLVGHGRRGLTCPPDDPAALAAALAQLAADPVLRRKMGAAGRDHVLAHHTWEGVARDVLAAVGLRLRDAA